MFNFESIQFNYHSKKSQSVFQKDRMLILVILALYTILLQTCYLSLHSNIS